MLNVPKARGANRCCSLPFWTGSGIKLIRALGWSSRRHGTAVDDMLGARDRPGARRDQECD